MSELQEEMTRAEMTRNEIEAAKDEFKHLAEGISSAAWVALTAEDPNQAGKAELQCVLRLALYHLGVMADMHAADLERVAGWYANERTLTECAIAISEREEAEQINGPRGTEASA